MKNDDEIELKIDENHRNRAKMEDSDPPKN